MLEWFDHYGAALLEPLEIWHIRALRDRFVQLTGRSPRPDRSYRPSRAARARHLAARAVAAGRRRLAF
jgi:hypothetical protein